MWQYIVTKIVKKWSFVLRWGSLLLTWLDTKNFVKYLTDCAHSKGFTSEVDSYENIENCPSNKNMRSERTHFLDKVLAWTCMYSPQKRTHYWSKTHPFFTPISSALVLHFRNQRCSSHFDIQYMVKWIPINRRTHCSMLISALQWATSIHVKQPSTNYFDLIKLYYIALLPTRTMQSGFLW